MRSTRSVLFVGIGIALLAASAGPAAAAVAAVSVESSGAALAVRVAYPTPLRAVLQTLCELTEANCTLPATMPDRLVAPRTVRGSWPEVVAELVQDSGGRFAATPSAPGRVAYLIVEARGSAPTTAQQRNGAAPGEGAGEEPLSGATHATADQEPRAVAEVPVVEEAPAAEPSSESAAAAEAGAGSLVSSASPAASVPGASFAMTPFSDGKGNPLLARVGNQAAGSSVGTTPGQAVLPYSDEIGNPIVIPITNEPLSLTLSPGRTARLGPPRSPSRARSSNIPSHRRRFRSLRITEQMMQSLAVAEPLMMSWINIPPAEVFP
jgi:hypothetical protein